MTNFEALTLAVAALAVLLTLAGVLVADGRARARNEVTAERVGKLEPLSDRVTTLEADARSDRTAMERHYHDDSEAFKRIEAGQNLMRRELLDAIEGIRRVVGREEPDHRR